MNIPPAEIAHEPIRGLIAATPTAFREDGEIDLGFIPALAVKLATDGVSGVFVNGTTGEGLSLNVEEREGQAQVWRDVLPDGMKLFVHVGALALPDARRLAAHAQKIGADAISALAPGFFKPQGVAGVAEWCAAIAEAAPRTPFYFYHIPAMSGVHLRVADFLREAGPRIPNLAGVKFTFEAVSDFQECQGLHDGRFDMLWGRDEMLLAAWATGARGAVGSTYSFAAPLYREMIAAFESGDLAGARKLQAEACRMIARLVGTGGVFSAIKQELRNQGLPISPAVRPPLVAISESAR